MEYVETAALKESFWRGCFGGRGSPEVFAAEESLAVNVSGGVPSDDFSVDELLDLSNEDGFDEEEGGEGQVAQEEGRREERSVEGKQSDGKASVSGFCQADDFLAVSAGALSVPVTPFDFPFCRYLFYFFFKKLYVENLDFF